jgi:N6-adenosine-specific RNA methylase IME4
MDISDAWPQVPVSSLRLHERAGLIPMTGAVDLSLLRQDVAARGLLDPLDVLDGVVLDGRARLYVVGELGWERVPVREVVPNDPVEHMLLAMLRRQHLTASQLATIALELDDVQGKTAPRSSGVATLPPAGKKRDRAARLVGISARTVQDAATVRAGDAELYGRVQAGTVSASRAASKLRRRQRDAALAVPAPLPEGPFEVIYADPPWQLGNPDSEHAPEQHYPTMPLEEIKSISIPAADSAVLFLWAVNSMLPQALELIEAWGFIYKAQQVWVKPSIKLGTYFRNRHELLLFGRRGNYPVPDPHDRVDSVIEAPAGRHSAKPPVVYELIERSYPAASKLELFRRGKPQPGWAAWGNEVTP